MRRTGDARHAYLDADGRPLNDPDVLQRIESLVIPPAWTDVWISPDPLGHIQAVGTDAAGRRQYIYHALWRAGRDNAKFDRALLLARSMASARGSASRDLGRPGFPQRRALAAAFRIIDLSSLRIGSEEYLRSNRSRGLTTLLLRHVSVDGETVLFEFRGKSGMEWESSLTDAALAGYVSELLAARGQRSRLLVWRDRAWRIVRPVDVNDDIRRRTRQEVTAKDFRTLRGTVVAARTLALIGPETTERARASAITESVRQTAAVLGNSPAVARSSYIDPRVFDRYRAGRLIDLRIGRSAERALIDLLES